ncbi:MAG: PleD family two-component system response regulator [Sphingomonadales bacterium]
MSARVLVVDDAITNVKFLEAKLTSEYFDVFCAMDGKSALKMIEREKPDIVLLDVMMPEMDGFEVCRRIKADPMTAHIPVVMVTALDRPRDRIAGLEAGADDFLTKPVDDTALFARVRSLVRLKMVTDELRMREATGSSLGVLGTSAPALDSEICGADILVVEDRATMAHRIGETLVDVGTTTVIAEAQMAIDEARARNFDLIVISATSSTFDGLRVCSHLRSLEETRQSPILAIVEDGDSQRLVRALEIGVNDYIVRPLDRNELLARARTQIRRKRYSDKLRENFHLSIKMAITDAVTNLYNRHYMSNHLDTLMSRSTQGGKPVSVMMIDIDHFKSVNDQYGHGVGDEVLRVFSQRLVSNIRGIDLASRYGGEEFVVIMPDTGLRLATAAASRLRREIAEQPIVTVSGDEPVAITISVGVATSAGPTDSTGRILERADAALYQAKREGRDRVVADSPELGLDRPARNKNVV